MKWLSNKAARATSPTLFYDTLVLISSNFSSFRQFAALTAEFSIAASLLIASVCGAQQLPDAAKAVTTTPKMATTAPAAAPGQIATGTLAWNRLTAPQQEALKPLAGSWQSISEPQRLKWLAISKNYPLLPQAEQTIMHGRMNEWVALSPAQRAEARLNFAKTKELSQQLTAEEKLSKWQAYQALSPSEKEILASKAGPKPIGAALAVRPVPPQKLVEVAPHSQTTGPPAKPLVALPATPPAKAPGVMPDAATSR